MTPTSRHVPPVLHRTARTMGATVVLVAAACASSGPEGPRTPARLAADSVLAIAPSSHDARGAMQAEAGIGPVPGDYTIGPRDRLAIDVFGVDDFSGEFRVSEGGDISMPLLGTVPVAGRTPREAEELVASRLRASYLHDPHVRVDVVEVRSHGVSVVGAVRQPGVYQVPEGTRLLEVLAMAEGLAEGAGNTAYIVRGSDGVTDPLQDPVSSPPATDAPSYPERGSTPGTDAVIQVDLGALLSSGVGEENHPIRPGDVVQVRPAGFVYVVGEVNRPGGFTIPPGDPLSVLEALALAGGLGRTAASDRSVIVRTDVDGSRQEISVDLDGALEGSVAPPTLAPKDVLFVPNNGAKSFALGFVNALVRMVTFRGLVY